MCYQQQQQIACVRTFQVCGGMSPYHLILNLAQNTTAAEYEKYGTIVWTFGVVMRRGVYVQVRPRIFMCSLLRVASERRSSGFFFVVERFVGIV